jgi:hypothetical protein
VKIKCEPSTVIEFVCDTSVFGSAMPRLVAQRTPGNVLGPYGYTGKFSNIKTDDLQVFYATGPILAFGGQKAKDDPCGYFCDSAPSITM